MALPGETIKHIVDTASCRDCRSSLNLEVSRSAAGFYIGTNCHCGPYSRESGYFPTREAAAAALESGDFGR